MAEQGKAPARSVLEHVRELAWHHANFPSPLGRIAFFDHFNLDSSKDYDGYTASGLYHLYLNIRTRERLKYG